MKFFCTILFIFCPLVYTSTPQGKYCSGVCVKQQQCVEKNEGPVIDKRIDLDDDFDVDDGCEGSLKCCLEENVVPEVISIGEPKIKNRESNYQPTACGIRKIEGLGFRVVENEEWETEYGEFPWMAAIYHASKFICGGSLIHPKAVLTSSHNIEGRRVKSLIVKLGEWDRNSKDELLPTQEREVNEIIIHPNYDNVKVYYDASLLILTENVDLVFNIQPICLPSAFTSFQQESCISTGWGKTEFQSKSLQNTLRKVDLPILPKVQCENRLRSSRLGQKFRLHDSFLCAGGISGKDTCTGDGGSPLVCLRPGSKDQYFQAGIVSWGIGCGDYPGIYTDVSAIRTWIDEELKERQMNINYYVAN